MTNTFFSLLVCLLIAFPFPAPSQDDEPPEKAETTGTPVSITLLIPGVSQLANKQYLKGSLLSAVFAGCCAGSLISNHRGYQLYDEYLASRNVDAITRLREDSERAFRYRNLFLIGATATWLLHLVDRKVFTQRSSIKSEIYQDGMAVGISFYF